MKEIRIDKKGLGGAGKCFLIVNVRSNVKLFFYFSVLYSNNFTCSNKIKIIELNFLRTVVKLVYYSSTV